MRYKQAPTNISVTKTWVGLKAGPITVHLFANGTDTGTTLTLDDTNNWTASFTNVRKYDQNGTEIQYTISEDAVSGYNTTITGNQTTGFTITNTEQPRITSTPKTSDNSHVMSYALLTLLSAFFVVIVASKRIKYSN